MTRRLTLNKKGEVVEARLKYGNTITVRDGIKFRSLGEADRYSELKLLLATGEIFNLQLQVKHKLVVRGIEVGTYASDFEYTERRVVPFPPPMRGSQIFDIHIIEDWKGKRTALFILKWNIMRAMYKDHIAHGHVELLLTGKPSNRIPWSLRRISALRKKAPKALS